MLIIQNEESSPKTPLIKGNATGGSQYTSDSTQTVTQSARKQKSLDPPPNKDFCKYNLSTQTFDANALDLKNNSLFVVRIFLIVFQYRKLKYLVSILYKTEMF